MPHCSNCHMYLNDPPYTNDDGEPLCKSCHKGWDLP